MAIEQDCARDPIAKEINLFALFDAKRSEIFFHARFALQCEWTFSSGTPLERFFLVRQIRLESKPRSKSLQRTD